MIRLPGTHPANIRNRSSKQLLWLSGVGHKLAVRSLPNAALEEMAKPDKKGRTMCYVAEKELNRRRNKHAKKEAKA